MVSVACLCVGKELLIGKTVNTNANWVGARLFGIGTMLDRILVVTDSLSEISSSLEELLSRKPDFVVVIGGLGPTPDDMTLEGIARAVGTKVKFSTAAWSMIQQHYASMGRVFEETPARKKMATIPEGATPIPNDAGTAPGVRIERSGAVIFCLPGVPREMKAIYKASVQPEIRKKVGTLYTSKTVMHLTRIGESILAPGIVEALRRYPEAYIKSHPKGAKDGQPSVELDLVTISTKKKEAESLCNEITRFFEDKIAAGGGTILKKTSSTVGR
jgi:nicotinamide-nucleotide amidase